MDKNVNVFSKKIVFYCDEIPIDAEPNVQKKYYGLNPNLSNAIAIILF